MSEHKLAVGEYVEDNVGGIWQLQIYQKHYTGNEQFIAREIVYSNRAPRLGMVSIDGKQFVVKDSSVVKEVIAVRDSSSIGTPYTAGVEESGQRSSETPPPSV